MTPDEMRVAVCEVLGWTGPYRYEWFSLEDCSTCVDFIGTDPTSARDILPALTLDLLHEAEATLTNDEWDEYYRQRYIIAKPKGAWTQHPGCDQLTRNFIHASTEEKATALLNAKRICQS